jgi:MraZ protein
VGGDGHPAQDSRQKSETRVVRSVVFRGATKVTLDAKGRMAIPTRYRARLASRCDGQIVLTVDKDHCLLVYPMPDWEELERKLVRLPMLIGQGNKFELWDEGTWNEKRDAWLSADDDGELPADLETISF